VVWQAPKFITSALFCSIHVAIRVHLSQVVDNSECLPLFTALDHHWHI